MSTGGAMNHAKFLGGKVALVTGGSRGIGAAIVQRLALNGATVAFTYSNSSQRAEEVERGVQAAGGSAVAMRADSADPAAVRQAVAETAGRLGRLDILVNNAGAAVIKPLDEFSLEEFDRLVAINVRAVFVASKEAARHMKEGGRIIMIGSVNAEHVPFTGAGVYAMTKAAVAGLTRGLCRDLGPRGITVNCVQPGPVDTEMNPGQGDFADSLRKLTAVSRYARSDEIAAMVAYLAGPEAGYVTGACLMIDGGFSA